MAKVDCPASSVLITEAKCSDANEHRPAKLAHSHMARPKSDSCTSAWGRLLGSRTLAGRGAPRSLSPSLVGNSLTRHAGRHPRDWSPAFGGRPKMVDLYARR